jgi:hypothetical protein
MPPDASGRRTIKMEMNRVEGDLKIQLEVEGHTVTDAWCIGTMYRGVEGPSTWLRQFTRLHRPVDDSTHGPARDG